MRMLTPAYVVATVVIAATGSAFAQSVARPAGTTAAPTSPPVKTTGAPAAAANRTSGAANPVTTLPNNNGNITSTTVTNADGSTTTTFSNGLTSNSNGISSTRSGSNMASSASNAPIGSTSANGSATANAGTTNGSSTTSANGSSTTNGSRVNGAVGTTNEGNTSTAASTVLAPGVVTPAIINGNLGSITSDGERVFDANGNPLDLNSNQVQLVNNGNAGSAITYETVRSGNTAGLDRAIKQTERDRKKIGRNGQLLQSIAPRTNVDRTDQMPDDGPTPALTGSASTLLQR